MPSAIHEALVHLFHESPELAALLLRDVLHAPLPPHGRVRNDTNTFSTLKPPQYGDVYFDLILTSLGHAARKAFEMSLANYQYQYPPLRESFNKGKLEGEAKGEAKALVAVLEARGIPLSDEQRERVFACTELEVLEQWIRRAVTIASADELFG